MASKTPTTATFDDVSLEDLISHRVRALLKVSDEKTEGLHPVIMREVERALIGTVLAHTDGHREGAARILGLHRNSLRLRIEALGLNKTEKAKRS